MKMWNTTETYTLTHIYLQMTVKTFWMELSVWHFFSSLPCRAFSVLPFLSLFLFGFFCSFFHSQSLSMPINISTWTLYIHYTVALCSVPCHGCATFKHTYTKQTKEKLSKSCVQIVGVFSCIFSLFFFRYIYLHVLIKLQEKNHVSSQSHLK